MREVDEPLVTTTPSACQSRFTPARSATDQLRSQTYGRDRAKLAGGSWNDGSKKIWGVPCPIDGRTE